MRNTSFVVPLLVTIGALAEGPLPGLRVEPTGGGSLFYIHNAHSEPLTAYLIELVNYPGSSYSFWQDDIEHSIPAGGDRRIQVTNMTVGAVPDYVKLQAAIYADGSTAGIPAKVTQLVERRRAILEATRELIRRCEKGADPAALKDELLRWAESMPPITRANRNSQEAINQPAVQGLIRDTARNLGTRSVDETLHQLRASEKLLAGSKPAL
jgi:hypothetical protein